MKKLLISILLSSLLLRPAQACEPETSTSEVSLQIEITSLYPNPNSGESEWIELTNLSHELIDLSLYTLEDETAKPWTLSGTLEESVTLTGFSFQLNNGGDTVTLKTLEATVVDSFNYSSSTKGEILTRVVEQSSSHAEQSVAQSTEEQVVEADPLVTPSLYPIFSEALPNPEGSDSTEEWVELYNPYGEVLPLKGLYLDDSDGGSSSYALSGNLAAESYLVIGVEESGITLNNDSDQVRLLGVSDEVLWEIPYEGSKEGYSYAYFGDYYDWMDEPTPGEENSVGADTASSDEVSTETDYADGDLSDEVEISEVYPNPEGPDAEEEWIELTNGGSEAVNLGNWTIDDGEGGSDPYTFPDDTVIEPGETLIVYRTESGIALNNSNETVQLSDYTDEVMDEISYESSEEDQSYAEIQVEEVESIQASASGLGNTVFHFGSGLPSPSTKTPCETNKGDVLEWNGSLLTLFDGVSTWTFKTESESADPLIYQIGNTVLVQAEAQDEVYEIRFSELVESVATATKKSFPWSWVASGMLATTYIGYEIYKKKKRKDSVQYLHSSP